MKEYWKKVYKTRYFWSHLAKNDLKTRFRRSKLGMLWTVLQPLMFTVILSFVFSVAFKEDMGEYSMYILSGIIVWNLLQSSIVASSNCLMISEQYIRQFNHPITIYSLRMAVLNIVTFLMEMSALVFWVLIFQPENLILAIFTLPLTVILYFPMVWGCATIAGYSGTKYRDYAQIMSLLMQMLYYLSPVFLKQELFMNSQIMMAIFRCNPVTHILDLIRKPFVYMEMPGWTDYLYIIAIDIIVILWAYAVNRKNQKKIVFYL